MTAAMIWRSRRFICSIAVIPTAYGPRKPSSGTVAAVRRRRWLQASRDTLRSTQRSVRLEVLAPPRKSARRIGVGLSTSDRGCAHARLHSTQRRTQLHEPHWPGSTALTGGRRGIDCGRECRPVRRPFRAPVRVRSDCRLEGAHRPRGRTDRLRCRPCPIARAARV
jgi:hypothetical protein